MRIESSIQSIISISRGGAARQLRAASIVLLFAIGMVLPWGMAHAGGAFIPPVDNPIKWHPGHYLMLVHPGPNNPWYMEQIYGDLKENTVFRGVVIRYRWSDLEPAKDVYDFSTIDKHLTELAVRKRRLVILLELRSSVDYSQAELVPDYVKAGMLYEGGIFPYSGSRSTDIKGYNIKLWNPLVRDRLAALVRELGERFNSHPYFEGFGLTETAMGKPLITLSNAEIDGYYNNIISINQQMRQHFPNTLVFQFINYPRQVIESFVNNMKKTGMALGCPDVFVDEPGLFYDATKNPPKGIYSYYPELSGKIPLTIQIEKANYENTRYDGKGYQPTISELLTFARHKLDVNYIFWTRSPDYFAEVLEVMNWKNQTSDVVGGLNPTCPSTYFACVD